MNNDISIALRDSISQEILNASSNLAEVGLDSIMEEGFLREMPFISNVISVYKIQKSIRERHYIKKLGIFISELNQGCVDEGKRQRIKSKIEESPKKRKKELEYLLLLIDRYIAEGKAAMLAKLYLAYLDKLISWDEVAKYAEVIDRLLPGDYEAMQETHWNDMNDSLVPDSLMRLIGLGMVISHDKDAAVPNTVGLLFIPSARTKDYELTAFGQKFLGCMQGELARDALE